MYLLNNQFQGLWGDFKNGCDFFDMVMFIKGIILRYLICLGIVGLLKVIYEIFYKIFEKELYVMDKGYGQYNEKVSVFFMLNLLCY